MGMAATAMGVTILYDSFGQGVTGLFVSSNMLLNAYYLHKNCKDNT